MTPANNNHDDSAMVLHRISQAKLRLQSALADLPPLEACIAMATLAAELACVAAVNPASAREVVSQLQAGMDQVLFDELGEAE